MSVHQDGYRTNERLNESHTWMYDLHGTIERIAVSDLGVRLVGEDGTGKTRLARLIHESSSRANAQFLAIDCVDLARHDIDQELFGTETLEFEGSRVVPGLFDAAKFGTIYFDRFPVLPPGVQKRLIRTLEYHCFCRVGGNELVPLNVRAIIGVSKRPYELDNLTRYDQDMTQRITPVCINVPPLRERKQDIPGLIQEFIAGAAIGAIRCPIGMSHSALDVCLSYDWPGNLHELKRVIEHAVRQCQTQFVQTNHLPEYLVPAKTGISMVTKWSIPVQ